MTITARGLNRATLGRQMLLGREPLGLADGVRRAVALQAQQEASPYIALWNRLAEFDPATLDAAFASHTVVKATSMRITLHATLAEEYPVFREATEPSLRAARLHDRRFTASGLTLEDADALVQEMLAYARQPRTADEVKDRVEEHLGTPLERLTWSMLRGYAPLLRAPTGGPWSFGPRPAYIAPETTPVMADLEIAAESLQKLVLRYLAGFGPASVADIAQFAMIQRVRAREALKALDGNLERLEGPNGEELFDIPGAPLPDEEVPAPPRLMAMWDSTLLAYFDRSRIIPPDYRKLMIRTNGDVLPSLLVDGYVAGVWRPVDGRIEATAFHPLPDDAWEGLASEARSLLAFLADRDPEVYRRYNHWWNKLPGGETRLLPGD